MAILRTFVAFLGLLATGAVAAPHRQTASKAGGRNSTSKAQGVPISNANTANLVANSYIVVYNKNASDADIDAHQATAMRTISKRNLQRRRDTSGTGSGADTSCRTFQIMAWRAMAVQAADDGLMRDIANSSTIQYIEQDAYVSTRALTTQTNATSGLARLSHANVDATNTYVFDDSAGQGITAYVVDTGIRATHSEFGGRATFAANFINDVDTDENGHGSHVAGTIGGRTFGVAKNVQLFGVKVLDADGAGTNSGVIAGMDFVAANATAMGLAGKAVMNMSLGGAKSAAVNAAIANIRAAGVVPVVAAGNENQDAANDSPASSPAAITVGAIDQTTDAKASFSNFGRSVDIFAPGVDVLSVGITSDTATDVLSGTSMASPHIAGLAAYLMALESITDVDTLTARLQTLATTTGVSVLANSRRTTNLIANNGNL